jgi:hypothetical protein
MHHRGTDMRSFVLSLLLLLIPCTVAARCAPFDFIESIDEIPLIIHGTVTESNKADLLASRCNPEVCKHRFNVRVLEILKGDGVDKNLRFQYDFVVQRPEIALFSEGEEFIFAVREVTANGQATLFGNTCGRAGVGIEYLDKVKEALKKKTAVSVE